MSESNYWHRLNRTRVNRRTMLSASAKAGVGVAGLALVGCGDDDDDDSAVADAPSAPSADDAADQVADQAADQAMDDEAVADQAADDDGDEVVAATGPVQGGSIRTYDQSDLASFDGFLTFGYKAFLHGQFAYPMLMKFKNVDAGPLDFSPEFWLAESVEQPDAVTHTFSIRENAVWEDVDPTNGRTVTGEDVKFAFSGERYAGYPNRGVILPHLDTIDTPDDKTITFNLNKPVAPFLLYQAHHAGPYTMPPEVVAAEQTRQGMVGAGPFRIRSYDTGSSVVYERSDSYWAAPKPYVDDVTVNFVSDDSAIQAGIRTGEINVVIRNMPNTIALDLIEEIPDATWVVIPLNVIGGTTVDLTLAPFNDPRARQALNNALDRDSLLAITDSLGKGGIWGSSMPQLDPWSIDSTPADSPLHEFYAHDVQRALQLLDAAGVSGTIGPFNFAIPAANTYGPTYTERGLVIQQNFKDIGVETNADLREATEHYSTTFRGTGNDGGFAKTSSVQVIEADELFRNMYIGDSPRSPIINGEVMFDDEILNGLIDDQLAATDSDARKAIIGDLQQQLAEQSYLLPDVYSAATWYSAPEIRNSWLKGSFTSAWALQEMWFEA